MSSASVEWILKLVDRASGPAEKIEKKLGLIERVMGRIDKATSVSGGGFGGLATQAERAAGRTERAWDRVHTSIGRTQTRLKGLATGALAIGAGLTGAGLLGKSIVDAAAYKQDQLTSLAAMLGSQKKASALFGRAQAFAAATPFSTEDVLNATKQAIGFGFTDRQAIPLVKLAGSLASGSGKSLDQAMEAFAALRGGDYGQAFGVGQGFSNLNISREQLVKAGLKFDKQGSYQGNTAQGLAAVRSIIESKYGGAMDAQSMNLSGLGSTLASRPRDLFMSLVDGNGKSAALAPLQQFMANLADLTDFSKGPGARIQTRFQASIGGLFKAIFNPLAGATGGSAGEKLIDSILDKVDQFSDWWTRNAPMIMANAKGIWQGLTAAFSMAKPLIDLLGKIGGDDSSADPKDDLPGPLKAMLDAGLLGKTLGFVGAIKGSMAGLDAATFGASTTLLAFAGSQVLGLVNKGLDLTKVKILQTSFAMEILTNPLGKMTGLRVALTTFVSGASAGMTGLLASIGPIGWALIAITATATALYFKYKPFHDLVDTTWDKVKNGYKKAGDWLGYGWNKFKDSINGADKSVNGWFADMADSFTNVFNVIPDRLKGVAVDIYNALLPAWLRQALSTVGINFGPAAGASGVAAGKGAAATAGQSASASALIGVANRLGINPESLLAVAYKESTLNPAAVNPDSKAAGLIQFLRGTAGQYGLRPGQMETLSADQQAPYIERYLRDHGVRAGASTEQVYAAVFGGSATRTGTLYSRGSQEYEQNKGLDTNGDGQITTAENAQAALDAYRSGITLNINVLGSVNPAAVAAIQRSVQTGLAGLNSEAGGGAPR